MGAGASRAASLEPALRASFQAPEEGSLSFPPARLPREETRSGAASALFTLVLLFWKGLVAKMSSWLSLGICSRNRHICCFRFSVPTLATMARGSFCPPSAKKKRGRGRERSAGEAAAEGASPRQGKKPRPRVGRRPPPSPLSVQACSRQRVTLSPWPGRPQGKTGIRSDLHLRPAFLQACWSFCGPASCPAPALPCTSAGTLQRIWPPRFWTPPSRSHSGAWGKKPRPCKTRRGPRQKAGVRWDLHTRSAGRPAAGVPLFTPGHSVALGGNSAVHLCQASQGRGSGSPFPAGVCVCV